jgi:uncharacterized membrane protein
MDFAARSALIVITLVTAAFHVPRNDGLAEVDPDSAEGQQVWADYLVSWTCGNHVRTLTAVLSVVGLLLGVVAQSDATA